MIEQIDFGPAWPSPKLDTGNMTKNAAESAEKEAMVHKERVRKELDDPCYGLTRSEQAAAKDAALDAWRSSGGDESKAEQLIQDIAVTKALRLKKIMPLVKETWAKSKLSKKNYSSKVEKNGGADSN